MRKIIGGFGREKSCEGGKGGEVIKFSLSLLFEFVGQHIRGLWEGMHLSRATHLGFLHLYISKNIRKTILAMSGQGVLPAILMEDRNNALFVQ